MTSGAEALRAAIRRSLPLILGLILLGVVAVNVLKIAQGSSYEANARVLLSTTLLNVVAETESALVDPERVQTTAIGIAESPQVYERAARETGERFGDADDLSSATSVTADSSTSDLITFTSTSSDPDRAVGMVNAVASAYIDFRGELLGGRIEDGVIERMRSRLDSLPPESQDRQALASQLNRLELLESVGGGDAELAERATSAVRASPDPLEDSLLGLSIGLVVALVLVGVREAIDTTVRSEADVEEILSVPVLASMRSLPRRAPIVAHGRHEAMVADAHALLAAHLAGEEQDGGLALALTSAGPLEGKTVTAANLAVAMARRGPRVVLADLDFREPALAEAFGIPSDAGGALQVMSGSVPLESALWSASLDGAGPHVWQIGGPRETTARPGDEGAVSLEVLPSGGTLATPNVPQRSGLASLLTQLRARADVIIVDTPPALVSADVAELSHLIDAVVVVVRQGRVSRRDLRALRRQTRTWPARLVGAVMTGVRVGDGYSRHSGGS